MNNQANSENRWMKTNFVPKPVSAVLYAFDHGQNPVIVAGLGGQLSKAVDVADQVEDVVDVEQTDNEQFLKDQLLGIRITLEKKEGSE